MSEFIEINWTCGSIEEARKISRFLVQERYVASAQIVPWLESISLWNSQLETVQESKVTLQTRKDHYEAIEKIILKNCTYQLPQITYQHIEDGSKEFLKWLQENTQRQFSEV